MKQVEVTLKLANFYGADCKVLDRKFFKDMVYQAMFYPGCSIIVGTCTLSGTTLLIKRKNQSGLKKHAGDFNKVVANLWARAQNAKNIVFRSKFEEVEYLIQENV